MFLPFNPVYCINVEEANMILEAGATCKGEVYVPLVTEDTLHLFHESMIERYKTREDLYKMCSMIAELYNKQPEIKKKQNELFNKMIGI